MPDLLDLDSMTARFDHLVLKPQKKGVLTFGCPLCGNKVRTDGAGMEPACTGPGWIDAHPLTIMRRVT